MQGKVDVKLEEKPSGRLLMSTNQAWQWITVDRDKLNAQVRSLDIAFSHFSVSSCKDSPVAAFHSLNMYNPHKRPCNSIQSISPST
jgi:hypothetical protein